MDQAVLARYVQSNGAQTSSLVSLFAPASKRSLTVVAWHSKEATMSAVRSYYRVERTNEEVARAREMIGRKYQLLTKFKC
jgi:hypothetical protein